MVYVDNYNAPYGRMIMCHMIADSTEELMAMADLIGLNRKWLQRAGTRHEHFDVSKQFKARALANGATEITYRQLAEITLRRLTP